MEKCLAKNQHKPLFNVKFSLQIIIPLLLFITIISIQLSKNIVFKRPPLTPSLNSSYPTIDQQEKLGPRKSPSCDIFTGKWIPNPEGPYYTNESCGMIQEHQNCMKHGRLDTEFMKWRWKPNECELPIFDPYLFLEIVKGKSLAFIGDSIARNHMQSLICLLSKVESPMDVLSNTKGDNFKRWYFKTYNFTVAIVWSPYLVTARENDPNGKPGYSFYGLYLDEADEAWKAHIDEFDYIIISAGHWFGRPIIYYTYRQFIGCRYCDNKNLTEYSLSFGYRNAFRTAFRAILESKSFKGMVFLRTFAPSHFEGGPWDKGGDCIRRRPFNNSEVNLEGENLESYKVQMEEFKEAQKLAQQRGLRFQLLDVTRPMLMRPDGHPSKFGRPAKYNGIWANDCVHWCLPGPIDSWNDILLEMLRI